MDLADSGNGRGSGSALHPAILWVAATSTAVATVVSATSIFMHLKNYRKPTLQRLVTFSYYQRFRWEPGSQETPFIREPE